MTPTDTQIIERLARFCGWYPCHYGDPDCWDNGKALKSFKDLKFLTSLDALRPVLEKLKGFQHAKLAAELDFSFAFPHRNDAIFYALTVKPRTLALALYEVIGE